MSSARIYIVRALIALLVASTLLLSADAARAQADEAGFVGTYNPGGCTGSFCPLAKISDSSKLGQLYSSGQGDLSNFINSLFKFTLAIGAIAAVLRLAWAGYLYMGSELWSSKSKAKEVIGDVTLGVLLLLGIWLILNQINPDILKLDALRRVQQSPVQQTSSQQIQAADQGARIGGGL